MKIFLDTADVNKLRLYSDMGLIDGVTTNPTHLSTVGGDPVKHVREICALFPEGDISVEVTETDPAQIYAQAKKIQALHSNVVVKVPAHKQYIATIRRLVDEGVAINVTLVFSVLQGLCMAKLGVRYISPFIGRLDDSGTDGIQVVAELREVFDNYSFDTQILAASIRDVAQVHDAAVIGADAVTMPPEIFEKMITHPLTDQGMQLFNAAWQQLGVRQFP
ncbi:MAG: transaldolase family protein [Candidatus Babeliales bacterium]